MKTHIAPAEFVKTYYKKGRNATQAIKSLDPELTQLSAENKGSRMLNNAKVQHLMQIVEDKINEGAVKGINRLNQLVDSENEKVAGTVSMYLVDHAKGKAMQKLQVTSTAVNINIDLTGTTGVEQGSD